MPSTGKKNSHETPVLTSIILLPGHRKIHDQHASYLPNVTVAGYSMTGKQDTKAD
jgi:hypothetical protein